MRVLVACEFTGTLRDAFISKEHDAVSCDLQDTEVPGPHYKGDVLDILNDNWDLMIAHPPCTYLASVSGQALKKDPSRLVKMQEGINFFNKLLNAPIHKICIENPIPLRKTKLWPPSQTIHPFWFGHAYTKPTCLWLKNLPNLVPTQFLKFVPKESWHDLNCFRSNDIARTFSGVAEAMADQWGSLSLDFKLGFL